MIAMKAPSEAELLGLWEHALVRHPLDRALLFCAWVRPELAPDEFANLPLGSINRSLLHLRELCFGQHISAWTDCEHCQERLEVNFDTAQLLAATDSNDTLVEFNVSGLPFRVPCSRDLAAVAQENDLDTAALKLLQRCCLVPADQATSNLGHLLKAAEAAMEQHDPAATLNLSLSCKDCGHSWETAFNIGSLLWDEIDAHARDLLAQVNSLARAYGWTEAEIFALSSPRRAVYLDMVGV